MDIVYKPWGKEVWLELNDKYCYKRIYINAGFQTSYHYHEVKLETNYIAKGKAEVWLENDSGVVEKTIKNEGDSFTVVPPRKHRVVAIKDVILQEVSTPEVDDVIRIEDDTNRSGGRLENEHEKPGVLILAAGKGERLKPLTDNISKALLPINNRAIISKLIKKFPNDYKFVITLAHKGKDIEDYLNITYPSHDFEFVYIDDITSNSSGPGYSALATKEFLNRPFYLLTVDCLVTSPLPSLYENWLGVHPTSFPEKYATVDIDENGIIKKVINKSEKGFSSAFIGIASISDHEIFWKELEQNIQNGELIDAFNNLNNYSDFKTKNLDWFDTGNLDDLEKARIFFDDKPLSLTKNNNEIVYKEDNKFLKFIPDKTRLENILARSKSIEKFLPKNIGIKESFLHYDWIDGTTLYELNEVEKYNSFIDYYFENIEFLDSNAKDLESFYINKTKKRLKTFTDIRGLDYSKNLYSINGKQYPSMNETILNFDFGKLLKNKYTKNFHGDLQFDNILYADGKYFYVDWRDSFGFSTTYGDVYYDLAKLYGGMLLPYNLMKDESNIELYEFSGNVEFKIKEIEEMIIVVDYFKDKIKSYDLDFDLVKDITGLIFVNMSPLHDEKFSKLLWFKGLSLLNDNR